MPQFFYWPHICPDADYVELSCTSSTQNTPKSFYRRDKQLFPAIKSPELIATDTVDPFPKTIQGSQYILVTTDRYSKLTRAVPIPKMKATYFLNLFKNHWLIPYGIPIYLHTDIETQFVSRFFATICALQGVNRLTTLAYRPQTNDQAE